MDLEPRKGVHGCDVFQEHELALIDTNAYVMGIWNHEKHETHEMAYTDRFGCGVFKNTDMHQLARMLM